MKVCFIPIDNRPVCYSLPEDIVSLDDDIEILIPPRYMLGGLTQNADVDALYEWLGTITDCDVFILSLDTLAYGGLIPSRRCPESFEEIKCRLERLKPLLKGRKVFAFSSIMRISNNNYNEEEKEYWKDYGKKIFEYSYSGMKKNDGIPSEIMKDYLETRKRNFEINKMYLEWQKEGIFDTLIFSKDDCAKQGLNVEEAKGLEKLGGTTKTGADEIPLTLLARSLEKEISVYVEFVEPDYKDCISNYEDVSIEKSVYGQLELGGFKLAKTAQNADIILIVNNFIEKQGELVMGWDTKKLNKKIVLPNKPYAIADVRFANGADNEFVEQILPQIDLENFYGYSAWNTSANTLGSLLAGIKFKWNAKKYNQNAFNNLQTIRFLDDWAYQANIRSMIKEPTDIKHLMCPFEKQIEEVFGIKTADFTYLYPWNRKFEIEICNNFVT